MTPRTGHPGVYIEEIPSGVRPIAPATTSTAAFVGAYRVGPFNRPVRIAGFADFEARFGGLSAESPASWAIRQFFRNGGEVAFVVRAGSEGPGEDETGHPVTAPVTGDQLIDAVKSLDSISPEVFNLLVLPDAAELPTSADRRDVYSEAERYCAARRAFLLVDIPEAVDTPAEMVDWMSSIGNALGENAAVFFPRLVVADPSRGRKRRNVGSAGTLAGIYARTDAARGVWKAPAGTEASIRGAAIVTRVDALQGEDLNSRGVNVLRLFPGFGPLVWGARTLAGGSQRASDWRYVPVRRTALFIEESLRRGLEWVVFEPNDEPLWAGIRASAGAFLHDLFRRGAFQGSTPREAYFVKCDRETTTQVDIQEGRLNVLVGFAPLKPAEFVVIRIAQKALPAGP